MPATSRHFPVPIEAFTDSVLAPLPLWAVCAIWAVWTLFVFLLGRVQGRRNEVARERWRLGAARELLRPGERLTEAVLRLHRERDEARSELAARTGFTSVPGDPGLFASLEEWHRACGCKTCRGRLDRIEELSARLTARGPLTDFADVAKKVGAAIVAESELRVASARSLRQAKDGEAALLHGIARGTLAFYTLEDGTGVFLASHLHPWAPKTLTLKRRGWLPNRSGSVDEVRVYELREVTP